MKYGIRRTLWDGPNGLDHVCDYSHQHKWGHMWIHPQSGEAFPTGAPVDYDTGTFAPPRPFRSLRVANEVARRLEKYWGMKHEVFKLE